MKPPRDQPSPFAAPEALVARHVVVGWAALLACSALGLGLEGLHGFKVAWYVDVANETRRAMWTLAHAHGSLLGLVNLAFAATAHLRALASARRRLASRCLLAATLLMPSGFFLGGAFPYDGDPGLGILLVPCGALLLLTSIGLVLLGPRRA